MGKPYENQFIKAKRERMQKMLAIVNTEKIVSYSKLLAKCQVLGMGEETARKNITALCDGGFIASHQGKLYELQTARENGIIGENLWKYQK